MLIRAGRVIEGAGLALRGGRPDGRVIPDRELARGPGPLCQALGIDRALDGADVCSAGSPLRMRPLAGRPPGRTISRARGWGSAWRPTGRGGSG